MDTNCSWIMKIKFLNMKRILNKISNSLIPVILLGVLAISCKEDLDELEPMRMFTPAGEIKASSFETQVKLSWNPSLYTTASNGVTYTVEVAADTLFETPVIVSVQTDTAGVVFTDDQLEVRKYYYARIKANALDSRPESKWVVSNRFRIRGEQIFLTPGPSDIIDNAVILKWKETAGLTKIVLTPEVGTPIQVTLSEADLAARSKMIDKLKASTTYTAEIFRNNISKGVLTFRTKESTVGGNVIDLTDFTNRPSVLQDTLGQIPSGSTVILKRGMTYNISSTTLLDRSVTIASENSFNPERATIFFTSNFDIAAGSAIDSVVFKNVVMRSDNYGGRYVFNIDNASTIGKIKFESTHAEIFRGLTRIKTAGVTVDKFIINNSVIDSLSNYGVLTIDNAGATVNDIVFSKSTFYKIERVIVSKSSSRSITIDKSTFFQAPEAGRYLIDYTTSLNVTNGIKFNNSITGLGKKVGETADVRGIRASSTTLITSSNSYATSDYVATSNQIPNLTVYSGTSFTLFEAPKSGNFKIIDPTFEGITSAGDPRWR